MRITRSAPPAAEPLAGRRARIQARTEQATIDIREADTNVVPAPGEEDFLVSILNRTPREPRHKRPGQHLHVSDLLNRCLRKFALVERHGVSVRPDRLSSSDVFTFAQGDAIHDAAKMMAALAAPETVWGKWSCKCGHLYHEQPCTLSELDMNELCPQCETPTNHYQEVSMRNDELMIVGNPDLILYYRNINAFHVTELKSIANDQWQELARAKPDHVLQVVFYWFLMRELGYRMTNRVSIIYITKGYLFKGKPYKEFVLDPEQELHRLDAYLEEARLVMQSRKNIAILPARVGCTTEHSAQAKKCEVCDICFAKGAP